MNSKFKTLLGNPFALLVIAGLLLVLSASGEAIASFVSRPPGASFWSTDGTLIDALTYIPMVLGICFLILFITTSSIAFYKMQKSS